MASTMVKEKAEEREILFLLWGGKDSSISSSGNLFWTCQIFMRFLISSNYKKSAKGVLEVSTRLLHMAERVEEVKSMRASSIRVFLFEIHLFML